LRAVTSVFRRTRNRGRFSLGDVNAAPVKITGVVQYSKSRRSMSAQGSKGRQAARTRRLHSPVSTARSSSTAARASTSGLAAGGTPYFLEANPNPEIAESQEFAAAARHDGIKYVDLLHRILALGMNRAAATVGAG
jgi:hypothetical protein